MGISRTTVQLLLEESSKRPFGGSVATLGRQHIYFSWADFQELAKVVSVPVPSGIEPQLHREQELSQRGFASDETILAGLGFSEVVTIDFSKFEEANELFDLNLHETPSHLRNRFDVILNTGTMEHIFHVPNVLSNLHRMLKPNGRLIHLSPMANYVDHGFYSFSPTFFADYYFVNHYLIHELLVCRMKTKGGAYSPVELFDYLKRGRSGFEVGTIRDDRIYHLWSVVQRGVESTCDVIPQQSAYVTQWESPDGSSDQALACQASEPEGTRADRLLKITSKWSPAHRIAQWLIQRWRTMVNSYRKRFQFPLPKRGEYH